VRASGRACKVKLQWQKLQQEYRLNMASKPPMRLHNGHRFPHFLDIAIPQPQVSKRNFFMLLQRLRKIIDRLN
jgi:hypothetical protein